ncbi:hypothetical protein Taro_036232 [Colocasia esculenta]|uniref:Uncharacterized protein n=1 Tax=Colocasia esculenta TaxID=4460 RepID=A0A843WCS3_COLES|nr:hypothetical protein [Colocasia esculenta]
MQKARSRCTLMRVATGSTEIAMGSTEIATGLSVRTGRSRRGHALSRSDHDGRCGRDGPVNAAYQAVAFTGSAPESE